MIGPDPKRSDDSVEAAAAWDARLRVPSADDEDRREFANWREADPDNHTAFDELQTALGALRDASAKHPELRAMRDAALEAVQPTRRWRRFGAVAAAAVALVGGALTLGTMSDHFSGSAAPDVMGPRSNAEVYATALGERSIVTLADGSRLTLNTDSRVYVDLRPKRRDATVLAGQALFEVAKDQTRPFVVRAGDKAVTALGTAFDVHLAPNGMEVTLIEGRVAIAKVEQSAAPAMELQPGQQLVAKEGRRALIRRVDVEKETSWREGRVFFEDQPLTEAVAEMNRYSSVKLVADPSLFSIRINGMFTAGQQASFARTLEAYLPVEAVRAGDQRIEIRPRA